MCVVSMVHDHYNPLFPEIERWVRPPSIIVPSSPYGPEFPWPPAPPVVDTAKANEFMKLIENFKRAKEAAELVDELTGQPDCLDPEKSKLEERIAMLEAELAARKELDAEVEKILPGPGGAFSVKSTSYRNGRRPSRFDGPWKPTFAEAAAAFILRYREELADANDKTIYEPFVAQESSKGPTAGGKRRYVVRRKLQSELMNSLTNADVDWSM